MSENQQHIDGGFDLLREPWITCVTVGGGVDDLGIEELLERAHELSEIVDPSPLVVASIMRLLEAVLLSALAIDAEDDWLDLWEAGRFDAAAMAAVRECCEGRMDLFSGQRPFYQSRDIEVTGKQERQKSVGYLFPDVATRTAVVHYAHAAEDSHAFCPVCCAKGLTMLPPFATSGGRTFTPSINRVPPTYVFPLGENLFRTLLLNYVLPDARPPEARVPDPGPIWAGDGVVGHKEERVSVGFIESLTWQPRRVRLLAPFSSGACTRCGRVSDRLVCRMVFDPGLSRPKDAAPWIDRWAAYTWQKDKTGKTSGRPEPMRPKEERQTWRDADALFLARVPDAEVGSRGRAARPVIVNQVARLAGEVRRCGLAAASTARFVAVGIRTSKMKVFEWRLDRFEFPVSVLDSAAAGLVMRALRHAETGGKEIGTALLRLHPGAERESPSWTDIRAAMADATGAAAREYWAALEPKFRSRIFDERLADHEEAQAAWLAEWISVVRATAVSVLERVLSAGDDTADGLRRQEAARHALYSRLKKGGVV
ncbi:MAG: type I-E CRISPR-associated protein Cse1/CasA [Propionibacterium sp.]|nr:type I-E CRISPR-associated protein Cse1/CasA [Propionibacterium sp.]